MQRQAQPVRESRNVESRVVDTPVTWNIVPMIGIKGSVSARLVSVINSNYTAINLIASLTETAQEWKTSAYITWYANAGLRMQIITDDEVSGREEMKGKKLDNVYSLANLQIIPFMIDNPF